jgi:ribosomal protein L24
MSIKKGDTVSWNWGDGTAEGKVKTIYTEDVTKTIKGTEVTRSATEDEPAYLIEQDDGDQVLKSASELN